VVRTVKIDEGPTIKRYRPRAMGHDPQEDQPHHRGGAGGPRGCRRYDTPEGEEE